MIVWRNQLVCIIIIRVLINFQILISYSVYSMCSHFKSMAIAS